jgi:hypothetical protein
MVCLTLIIISYPIINTVREINKLPWMDNPFKLWHYILLALSFLLLEIVAQLIIHGINKKSEYGP